MNVLFPRGEVRCFLIEEAMRHPRVRVHGGNPSGNSGYKVVLILNFPGEKGMHDFSALLSKVGVCPPISEKNGDGRTFLKMYVEWSFLDAFCTSNHFTTRVVLFTSLVSWEWHRARNSLALSFDAMFISDAGLPQERI